MLFGMMLFGGSSSAQLTGSIRGKVAVPATDELTEEIMRGRMLMRYQSHGANSEEAVKPYKLAEKAVVYIESMSNDSTYTVPEVNPKLLQSQMMFHPLVLPVIVGTTVDFPNNDNLYHNVFSYSQPKEFDLGRYPQGRSKSVTFDKEGVTKIYCDIHTYMYATILVLSNPYFTVPEEDGSYIIKNVPAGTYRLSYWYGRKKMSTMTVTVHADQTSTINFGYSE